MPLPRSEGRVSVKSQESRPKKFCAILAFLTAFFAISAALSRFSPTFESKNMLQTARAARRAKIFTREAKCHVTSRHLPGIRAPSCHVTSRHLPMSRRYMTLTFASDPRDILVNPKAKGATPEHEQPGGEAQGRLRHKVVGSQSGYHVRSCRAYSPRLWGVR